MRTLEGQAHFSCDVVLTQIESLQNLEQICMRTPAYLATADLINEPPAHQFP
jgi:hypothetical protein